MRTFSLGAGKDTVVFSSKLETDANTITNFGADDVLQFTKTSQFDGLGDLAGTDLKEVTSTSTVTLNAAATTIYKGTKNDLQTHLKGTSSTFENKVVVAIATDVGNEGIYAATLTSAGATLVKVGTLDVDLSTLTMANFAAA